MKNRKEKHAVDLLDLPQKERVRLCREIRGILHQKVLEEKKLQLENETETHQSFERGEVLAKTPNSHRMSSGSHQIWNRAV